MLSGLVNRLKARQKAARERRNVLNMLENRQRLYSKGMRYIYPAHLKVNWNVNNNNQRKINCARTNLTARKPRRDVLFRLYLSQNKISNAAVRELIKWKSREIATRLIVERNRNARR